MFIQLYVAKECIFKRRRLPQQQFRRSAYRSFQTWHKKLSKIGVQHLPWRVLFVHPTCCYDDTIHFFHVQQWNRIPFDSEIDFLLQYCLGITQNQQLPKHYHFLVERIYNSCVNLFHSLSLKRDVSSRKNCSWQKHLSAKDKDIFSDPSAPFKPLPKMYKNRKNSTIQ